MFCPKCSKINPESNDLCSNCGAVLHEEREYSPIRKNGVLKAVLTVVLAVAVVVALVILLNGCDPGSITQDSISF